MRSLFRLMAGLPLRLLHAFGALLGWLAFALSPTYRRRFLGNAAQAGLAYAQVRGAVAESGKLIGELPRLWFGKPVPVQWHGQDLVEQARATGRGILFLTPHLGAFEVTAQAFAARFGRVTVLYRPARKAWLRDLVDTSRARENLVTVPTTLAGVRQMLRALQGGEAVGLLPDQVPPDGQGVWASFFGRDAYTMTLPAKLARQTQAIVLLIWGERLAGGRGYDIRVSAWEGELGADAADSARLLNAQMERLVREAPQQYLWGYQRYKAPRKDPAP